MEKTSSFEPKLPNKASLHNGQHLSTKALPLPIHEQYIREVEAAQLYNQAMVAAPNQLR